MTLKQWVAGAALAAGMVGGASAGLLVTVDGPDHDDDIDIRFTYTSVPGTGPRLNTILMDLTGTSVTFVNGDQGNISGNAGFTGATLSPNGRLLTLNFNDFDEGNAWGIFDANLNPGSPRVDSLIGTIFTATYQGGAVEYYRLIDDTGPGNSDRNGLISTAYVPPAQVPVPASAFLLGAGLLGLGAASRRRR